MKEFLLSFIALIICLPLFAQRDANKEILIFFLEGVSWETKIVNGISTQVVQVKKESLKQALKELDILESDLIVAMPDFNRADTIHVLPDGKVLRTSDMSKLYRYTIKPNQTREELIPKLLALKEVLHAHKNGYTIPDSAPNRTHFFDGKILDYIGPPISSNYTPGVFTKSLESINIKTVKEISGFTNYKPGKWIIKPVTLKKERSSSNNQVDFAANKNNITAYPNPTTDVLRIQFDNIGTLETLPSQINLYDQWLQKAVRTVSINYITNLSGNHLDNKVEMDVQDLPRGIYYLQAIPSNEKKNKTQFIRILLK